jgi:hypothetical protein
MLSTLPLRLKIGTDRTSGFPLQLAARQDIALGDLGLGVFARHFHCHTMGLAIITMSYKEVGNVHHGYRLQHACH